MTRLGDKGGETESDQNENNEPCRRSQLDYSRTTNWCYTANSVMDSRRLHVHGDDIHRQKKTEAEKKMDKSQSLNEREVWN